MWDRVERCNHVLITFSFFFLFFLIDQTHNRSKKKKEEKMMGIHVTIKLYTRRKIEKTSLPAWRANNCILINIITLLNYGILRHEDVCRSCMTVPKFSTTKSCIRSLRIRVKQGNYSLTIDLEWYEGEIRVTVLSILRSIWLTSLWRSLGTKILVFSKEALFTRFTHSSSSTMYVEVEEIRLSLKNRYKEDVDV